jgi:hypothetical protein
MPSQRRVKQWMNEHSDFNVLYRQSVQDRLDVFEEQIILIADDAKNDFKMVTTRGATKRVLDGEAIARAKLRVEMRLLI